MPEILDSQMIDFSDLESKYHVAFEDTFTTVVCISNLPQVPQEKHEKLISVIKKLFKNHGQILHAFMPVDASGLSKGFLFLDFDAPAHAHMAVKQADGYRLDKSHVLSVFMFDDIERYATLSDEYLEPAETPFEPKEHLKSWLSDDRSRDQFALLKQDQVSIYYNNKSEKPDLCESRSVYLLLNFLIVLLELDRFLCFLVSNGILSIYNTQARCCFMGWCFMEEIGSICASERETFGLFTQ
jgi:translation initiation factor 3 subunit B